MEEPINHKALFLMNHFLEKYRQKKEQQLHLQLDNAPEKKSSKPTPLTEEEIALTKEMFIDVEWV
jgi:hypothetical protein